MYKQVEMEIEKGLRDVINGNSDEYDNSLGNMAMVEGIAENLGLFRKGDIERNGWDSDYWLNVGDDENTYCITGSGFYGGIGFHRED